MSEDIETIVLDQVRTSEQFCLQLDEDVGKNAQLLDKVRFLYFAAYLFSYHEKAINALYELAYELPAICLPQQDGGIPLSVIPNGTTSKLAGLFSSLSL